MCYNAASLTQASLKYAKHRGDDPDEIARIEEKLEKERILLKPLFHVNGFAHPKLLTFTNKEPFEPKFQTWGLIPSRTKDEQSAATIANQTLNARSESIFEKPSFRSSAKNKRCLIYLDAFYEFHHLKGKTYPFHVCMKDGSPLILAGLWEEWLNKNTGELIPTVSIVTTHAGPVMSEIHNNPKNKGPRVPVILSKENQDQWLREIKSEEDKVELMRLTEPFDENLLSFHTVKSILGKEASGNVPEAEAEYTYDELQELFTRI
jgi:putative SOS response-associated peptidase YedK